jgi:hypothetical protein
MTISNSIDCFGLGLDSQWGVMVWGVDSWGENTSNEIVNYITKVIDNTLSPDTTISLAADYVRTVEDTLSLSFETEDEIIQVENWEYVFTKPTTDAEERSQASWIEV